MHNATRIGRTILSGSVQGFCSDGSIYVTRRRQNNCNGQSAESGRIKTNDRTLVLPTQMKNVDFQLFLFLTFILGEFICAKQLIINHLYLLAKQQSIYNITDNLSSIHFLSFALIPVSRCYRSVKHICQHCYITFAS